jgi:tetratricopeptide (TPR) repeat protein
MTQNFLTLLLAFLLAIPINGTAAVPPAAELLIAGRIDEAVGYLRSRVQSQPNDAEAYALLMRAHYALEHWDDAIAAGLKATVLAPDNSEYHMWLARSYGEKASRANWLSAISLARKCRAEFERSVELNGGNVQGRTDLAEYYIEAPSFLGGGKDKARAEAQALEQIGQPGNAHWIRAKIAESDKNYALSEQELRTGVQVSHGDPDLLVELASFFRRRGRLNEMEATVNEAAQSAIRLERPGALLDCAQILNDNRRNLYAAATLLRNYINGPVHSETAPVFRAHYLLGKIMENMGNKQAAANEYRATLALAADFQPAASALKRIH